MWEKINMEENKNHTHYRNLQEQIWKKIKIIAKCFHMFLKRQPSVKQSEMQTSPSEPAMWPKFTHLRLVPFVCDVSVKKPAFQV
jgi:hypothetical protein